ncbi:MAG: RHS repeat-associated core domain-containing protein, partial [Desulfobacterales bacterium]|nr:RHS repeat-associated core domain-containing protein [Desulfobacterales bacterium]
SVVYYYLYDANGNVGQLVNAADGSIAAHYEYDPFGNIIKSEGEYKDSNLYRFSTKYFDAETGFLYYGFRFYSAELGRWINRDPMGEIGGLNLYLYVLNSPVNFIDFLNNLIQTDNNGFSMYTPDIMFAVERNAGSGSAECDETTGEMKKSVDEACAGNCVERHENIHVMNSKSCCKGYYNCIKKLGKDGCKRAFSIWWYDNNDWDECKAHTDTAICYYTLLEKCKKSPCGISKKCRRSLESNHTRSKKMVQHHCSGRRIPCPFN